jgi:hypothetical protein
MVRFIATHLATARDTSMCGDTEFEKRCCTPNVEGNEIKKKSWFFQQDSGCFLRYNKEDKMGSSYSMH